MSLLRLPKKTLTNFWTEIKKNVHFQNVYKNLLISTRDHRKKRLALSESKKIKKRKLRSQKVVRFSTSNMRHVPEHRDSWGILREETCLFLL